MSRATRYIDNAGDKILYEASSKSALILDKAGKTVKTVMNNVDLANKMKSKGWKINNW